jgi:hypothetical protein
MKYADNMSYSAPDIELADFIRHRIACGFQDSQAVQEGVSELEMYEGRDKLQIYNLVEDLVAQHKAEQVTWPEVTHCDRLDRAMRFATKLPRLVSNDGGSTDTPFTICRTATQR